MNTVRWAVAAVAVVAASSCASAPPLSPVLALHAIMVKNKPLAAPGARMADGIWKFSWAGNGKQYELLAEIKFSDKANGEREASTFNGMGVKISGNGSTSTDGSFTAFYKTSGQVYPEGTTIQGYLTSNTTLIGGAIVKSRESDGGVSENTFEATGKHLGN